MRLIVGAWRRVIFPATYKNKTGRNMMQSVLMLSFAVSIMLGMWVIWRITP